MANTQKESDIRDKIREMIDERKNQKTEAVFEALSSTLQELFVMTDSVSEKTT